MNSGRTDAPQPQTNDPTVDEVRRIRHEIAAQHGNDLDRLAEHLRQVERAYAERQGVFAAATSEAAARVEASWGDMTGRGQDDLIDEVRALRRAHAERTGRTEA